jgi:hypothetical protein
MGKGIRASLLFVLAMTGLAEPRCSLPAINRGQAPWKQT